MRRRRIFVFLYFVFVIFSLSFVTGCSQEREDEDYSPQQIQQRTLFTDEELFRIDSLFEHTIMMIDFSSQRQIERVGLNTTGLERTLGQGPLDKLQILQDSYGVDLSNETYADQILLLENIMLEMMVDWDLSGDDLFS